MPLELSKHSKRNSVPLFLRVVFLVGTPAVNLSGNAEPQLAYELVIKIKRLAFRVPEFVGK